MFAYQKKIIKIIATRCYILRLKYTRFGFGCGSAPDPDGGADSTPKPLSSIQGVLLLRKGRGERKRGKGKKGKVRKRKGREVGGEGQGGYSALPPLG